MTIVAVMPFKKMRGSFSVLSRTSPAVCASDSNPAYAKKKRRQRRREPAESMRDERPIIRKSNRKHSRHDQDYQRQSEQRAHPIHNPPEPPHARNVNRIEEDETGDRNRQRRSATSEQLDKVLAKRNREIRQRPDIRNDLQPNTD